MERNRAGGFWDLGSFYLGQKKKKKRKKRGCLGTFARIGLAPDSPKILVSLCLGHRHCSCLPGHASNNFTHFSFRLGKYLADAHSLDLRVLFWVPDQQRKLQRDSSPVLWPYLPHSILQVLKAAYSFTNHWFRPKLSR